MGTVSHWWSQFSGDKFCQVVGYRPNGVDDQSEWNLSFVNFRQAIHTGRSWSLLMQPGSNLLVQTSCINYPICFLGKTPSRPNSASCNWYPQAVFSSSQYIFPVVKWHLLSLCLQVWQQCLRNLGCVQGPLVECRVRFRSWFFEMAWQVPLLISSATSGGVALRQLQRLYSRRN